MRRSSLVLSLAAVVALVAFRLAIVRTWHAPGWDGLQYFALSQQLWSTGRFAYAPPPAPLAYTRMPGYPLFLAAVDHHAPISLERHLRIATTTNVFIDLVTALAVLALLRLATTARGARLAFVLTMLCPLVMLVSCYGLTETLATSLSTLAIVAAWRARTEPRATLFAALSGVAVGACMLVRADAVLLAPPVAIALLSSALPWKRRVAVSVVAGAAAAIVFAPWPIRNVVRFGAPHAAATTWRDAQGRPLPVEVYDWMRTWSSSAPGEDFYDIGFVNDHAIATSILRPNMWDDERERGRVIALFDRYNRERFTPAVVGEFEALAKERTRRHPLRTLVTLPAQRIFHLWDGVPEWELPMRVYWLGLPKLRWLFNVYDWLLYAVALAGGVLLWRRGAHGENRPFVAVVVTAVALRTATFAFVIPNAANQRYVVEAFPLLVVCAAAAITIAGEKIRARRSPAR